MGNRAVNLEIAITGYQIVGTVLTRETFAQNWATIQNNLGSAYSNRIKGEKAENIEAAISACQAALEVRTCEAFPQDYVDTCFNLGLTYRNAHKFPDAYNTFANAIKTVESLREKIVSGSEVKQKLAEESSSSYWFMVLTCQDLGKLGEALKYFERSKNRNLVEQILERDHNTIFPPDVVKQLEQLHDKIASGQQQIQAGIAENYQELAEYLQKLRQQRNQLQDKYLPVGSGFNFEQFQATLDERTAIIEWYVTSVRILAFVISKDSKLAVWRSKPEEPHNLFNWYTWYLEYLRANYSNKIEWQKSLTSRLNGLAEILYIGEVLQLIPESCSRLILIPHWFLHLFPLHALQSKRQTTKGEVSGTLMELFPDGVSYAPSCQLLQQLQTRKRPDFQSLFAIQNPTEDLKFTDMEVESILSYFSHSQVLSKEQATKTALDKATSQLKEAHCLHFSCHGSFNLQSPQDSLLLLADAYVNQIPPGKDSQNYLQVEENKFIDIRKCLTLGNLFERKYNLNQCRLVVLSACETGLIDFNNTSDEYIGLSSGFLYAGSSSVVSSLWSVREDSTAYLLIKFYENLNQGLPVPLALNQAQLWFN